MEAARSDETDGGGGPSVQVNPGLSQNGAPPPFLSKTYEMVDDVETDAVISWGPQNNSFVVWDQSELARVLLPKYFKHSNFSSFVRQLNTYGFKKVDPDKWEFANEGFLRGQKHLLKKINRRKPSHVHSQAQQPQSQNASTASCVEVGKFGVEEEIEWLKRDKNVLMQELVRLRQQQQESDSQLQILGNRLQGMESRQKLMMSFLAKAMRSPGLFSQLVQQNESNHHIAGLNKKRKFLRQDQSATSPDGQIIKYQPLTNEMLKLDSSPGSLLVDNFSMLPEVAQNEVVPSFTPVSSGFPVACSASVVADQDINILSEIPMAIPCELPVSDIPIEDFVVSEGEHMPIVEADNDPKLLDIMDSLLEEFIAASPECGEMEVASSLLEAVEMQQPKSGGGGCENAGSVDNLMAQMGLLTS